MRGRFKAAICGVLALSVLLQAPPLSAQTSAAPGCRAFPETGQQVCARFLQYWDTHGGLAQQGYPISGELKEKSDTNGKTYTVQYFERAVFELHPENPPPYDVLLQLLGVFAYRGKYPAGASGQGPVLPDASLSGAAGSARQFPETGHAVSGLFLDYWQAHGGLAQQGYPISDLSRERSDLDGKTYIVQYFERSVLEYHPENKAPYNVLLSQLGTMRFRSKYPAVTTASPTPNPPGDVWAQLAGRPLKLPALSQTGKCPANTGKTVSPDYGTALGDGPVYAVGFSADGKIDLAGSLRDGGGYYTKVLWVAQPGYNAPVLVRGAQLTGSGTAMVRFGDGTSPSDQLRLDPDTAATSAAGWHEWPTHTRLTGAGCYAYQLDGPDFSQVIVFWAIMTMP